MMQERIREKRKDPSVRTYSVNWMFLRQDRNKEVFQKKETFQQNIK